MTLASFKVSMAMATACLEKVSTNQGMGIVELRGMAMEGFQTDVLNPRVVLGNFHSGTATGHTGHTSNTALVVTHACKINGKRQIVNLQINLVKKKPSCSQATKENLFFTMLVSKKRVRRAAKGHF